ncbi:hypothetical protein ACVWY0_003968 [Arthrobacter sp. UYNi723]
MSRERAPFRLLRTAAVAVSVLSMAAAAHVFGGGRLPPVSVLAACAALVVLGVVLLTRWKLRTPVLFGVLAAGQVLLHAAFSFLSETAPLDAASALHRHFAVTDAAPVHAGGGAHTHLPWDLEPPMLTAHIIATLVTAAVLAKGEAALWALEAWLRPFPGVTVAPVLPVAVVPAPLPRRTPVRRRPVLRAHRRRGPPAACT